MHRRGAHDDPLLGKQLEKLYTFMSANDTDVSEEEFTECLTVAASALAVRKLGEFDEHELAIGDCMYTAGPSIDTLFTWGSYNKAVQMITKSELKVFPRTLICMQLHCKHSTSDR